MGKKIPQKKNKERSSQGDKQYNTIYLKLFFAALILILYGRSIGYDFTLDDDLYIKNNPVVQQGLAKIGYVFTHGTLEHFIGSNFQVYRPLFITSFCIQKGFFGFEPGGYHFISVLLYILLSITLFNLLYKLLKEVNVNYLAIIVFLFIVHPVHSEVVANVKSQDELLSSLFCLLALSVALNAFQKNEITDIRTMTKAAAIFLLALFCKESSAAFIAIFPLTFLLIKRQSIKKTILNSLPFIGSVVIFLIVRSFALKKNFYATETTIMENVLYGAKNFGEETATKLAILLQYLKLMVMPYPLSWDYSYNQIPVTGWNSAIPFISLFFYLALAVLFFVCMKKQPAISFGIAFFLILLSPTANIFFLNGTTMAERFLFLPSVGFILALVLGILILTKTEMQNLSVEKRKRVFAIAAPVLIVFSVITFGRCGEWKNNFSIFEADVNSAPNSSRANAAYATELMNKAQKEDNQASQQELMKRAIDYYSKCLAIFPGNHDAAYKRGMIYDQLGEKENAISSYRQAVTARPTNVIALNNLGVLYDNQLKYDSALFFLSQSYKVDSTNRMTIINLAVVNSQKGDNDKVIFFGLRALELNYGDEKTYNLLANAYSNKGDMATSQRYSQMTGAPAASSLNPGGK